ncbi:hypothetical protein CMI37_00265 [Candidatus Pacearchaeota archaeon]|nr:hypothetical protein [Candidatus Pacearchaeota archaeon]|tara:strand:- start:1148 stop:2737 length:1590 start_codon:yes stop_codon:yes gene_type:complete
MSQNIKQIIKREYLRCASDPVYFMKKYCIIQHPQQGKIKFDLYDFQEKTLQEIVENRYNIVLKSRQLGISTLVAGYSLYTILFHNDKNILVIATSKDTAKNLVTKVRVMYENLPSWVKTKLEEDNKLSLRFTNGSQIKAIASNESAGRSEALSLLILDEAAFIDKIDEIWTASQQTLATGGNCVVISTPNGVGNWFHKMWTSAVDGDNQFNFVELPWNLHPDRDQLWRNEQDRILGPTKAAQECDADFLSSGNSIVDPKILQWYKENLVKDPLEKGGIDQNLWVWDYPNYSKEYLVVADVARGDGSDYSAAQVFDVESLDQVAEYKGQLSTTDFGNFLIELSTKYNDALLVIENNNVGWATIQTIIDREYKNLFYQSKDLQYVDVEHQLQSNRYTAQDRNMVPGFSTTIKTRPLIVAKMEEYIREKLVKINSARLIEELFVFIYNNNKAEAMSGYNDDLVIAYAIALWVRDTALRLKKEKDNLQRAMLGSILNSNKGHDAGFSKGKIKPKDNQWEIDIGGQKEDLTWLL